MNIKRIREFAKESGLPEKRTEELVNSLHPDENGELDIAEAMDAMLVVAEIARARECTKVLLEEGKKIRARRAQR